MVRFTYSKKKKIIIFQSKKEHILFFMNIFNNEAHMQGMYVTEILSDHEQNEYLQNLLDIWYNPVTIHSEEFGDMVLDKGLMWYAVEKNGAGSKLISIWKLQ